MFVIRFALLSLLMFVVALPAQANCFNREEVAAEQGLRIHSELMQIGLNCMGILRQPNLYSDYRQFTKQNNAVITGWENTLTSYFARTGGGNGQTEFHDYRTRIANQMSSSAARMRPDVFCHNHVRRLNSAMRMSQQDVMRWAAHKGGGQLPSKPLCASATR